MRKAVEGVRFGESGGGGEWGGLRIGVTVGGMLSPGLFVLVAGIVDGWGVRDATAEASVGVSFSNTLPGWPCRPPKCNDEGGC